MYKSALIPARLESLDERVQPNRVELVKPTYTIGRTSERDIVINDQRVSRLHATLTQKDSLFVLVDNDSANGTYVNRVSLKLHEHKVLQNRDEISFLPSAPPMLLFFSEDATVKLIPKLDWDTNTGQFMFCGRPVKLTPEQLRVLMHLWQHREQVVAKADCAAALWPEKAGYDKYVDDDAIEKCIQRIRSRLKEIDLSGERLISTQRGFGYKVHSVVPPQ